MSKPVIEIQGLSKSYRLGAIGATTIRDSAEGLWLRMRGKAPKLDIQEFWALQGVSFSVQAGEVVGVIGRNGAGKSTLLKILSRITEPTGGRAILRGRVASLLEVGTGFHPDLTGRENVYLNGAILGMTRAEVRRKFDEIVAFAEVERFIDTPVKRYSSGMYVRLAFAVAAHLEPEVLIIDEVLAVGDLEFQAKCIGKIEAVSKTGRTVLFVSHNLDSIMRLCSRAVVLQKGKVAADGVPGVAVKSYLEGRSLSAAEIDLSGERQSGRLRAGFVAISTAAESAWSFPFGEPIEFSIEFELKAALRSVEILFAIFTGTGFEITSANSRGFINAHEMAAGRYTCRVKLPHTKLTPGSYTINLGLKSAGGEEDFVAEAVHFEVTVSMESSRLNVDFIRAASVADVEFTITS